MDKKGEYQNLFKLYPPVISKEQFYRICNISKKTAAHLLDNGLVPCINNGKRTRKYNINLKDVIEYLEIREVDPGRFAAPYGWYKARMMPGPKRLVLTKANVKKIQHYFENLLSVCPDLLSVAQVSEITGYSTTSILRWINKGYLKRFDLGNHFLIPKTWLLEFLAGPDYMKQLVNSNFDQNRILRIFNDE